MRNIFDLSGKTAFITGASSGLGEQFSRCLSGAGARVILAARGLDKLKKFAAELGNASPIEMDVTQASSVLKAFDQLDKAGEKIDICINAAGILKNTPLFETDNEDSFQQVMNINVMGLWHVTKAVASHMKDHTIRGSIINIGSTLGGDRLRENLGAYAASKAAVHHLTKALVGELSPHNIRINCISPGLFHTPLTDFKLKTEEMRESIAQFIPLGFVGVPKDLDGVVLFLASNEASRYMTGSIVTVDGGISWGGAKN